MVICSRPLRQVDIVNLPLDRDLYVGHLPLQLLLQMEVWDVVKALVLHTWLLLILSLYYVAGHFHIPAEGLFVPGLPQHLLDRVDCVEDILAKALDRERSFLAGRIVFYPHSHSHGTMHVVDALESDRFRMALSLMLLLTCSFRIRSLIQHLAWSTLA